MSPVQFAAWVLLPESAEELFPLRHYAHRWEARRGALRHGAQLNALASRMSGGRRLHSLPTEAA